MKSSTPLISVLMPAYNAEKFIKQAIESILNQGHTQWELLILNDGSSDSTQKIIDGFSDKRIKVFEHDKNQGYLLSCNELFDKVIGDFITFLDADDTCPINRLSLVLEEFRTRPELDFLTTDYQRISESGQVLSTNNAAIDYHRYSRDYPYNPTICCASIFVRAEILKKGENYRPFFKNIGGEDYFWLWELSRVGKGKHLQTSLYNYRFHPQQTSLSHSDELSLFLPELLRRLKQRFEHSKWDNQIAVEVKKEIIDGYLNSPFELNLRKAQMGINRNPESVFGYARNAFLEIRNPTQLIRFIYLLYSFIMKKLGL